MRQGITAALVAGAFLTIAGAAQAAPMATAPLAGGASDLVEHVAQGCGPGYFRGPRGFCRPMRGGYYGPRPGWGPRCFVRPTPWGPRRVCR